MRDGEGAGRDDRGRPLVAMSETTTLANHTGSWKYIRPVYRDRIAPCNERCPVGIDIEGYMNLVRQDRMEEAIDVLLRENPMPAVTGRVCHHPCELACNRDTFDEPVSIHAVERALGDHWLSMPARPAAERVHEETVAVVGSGPAGLSCAYHLARMGYAVTVFDDAEEPGGMLRQGIPEYRLPRTILDAQIERIRAEGVEFRTGVRLGNGVGWEALRGFDALFIGTGAHRSKPLGLPGEDGPGILAGLDFLKTVNRHHWPEIGRKVVVVGGGNTAMDCARTARRLGAHVVVAYRRTRAEMPAIPQEIDEAEREGVEFVFLAAPVAFLSEDGALEAVECTRMELGEPDASGRRRPVPIEDSRFTIPADTVLKATGEDVELEQLPAGVTGRSGVEKGYFGEVRRVADQDGGGAGGVVHAALLMKLPVIFAGGDAAGDERTVAHALGAGKRAAIGIDRKFRERGRVRARRASPDGSGDEDRMANLLGTWKEKARSELTLGPEGNVSVTRWRGDDPVHRESPVNDVVSPELMNMEHFAHVRRHEDRHLPAEALSGFGEVNLGLELEAALEEARRCLNCGVCNQCELCLIFCSD
ncbi:MAG: FAD-dependent oxidoreductase, partial [Gemmatimonadota bacterium]